MIARIENRQSLYAEVTARVISELEQGRLPWVQPWDAAGCDCAMPANAVTGRGYSGINILILWAAVVDGRYASQRWLTFRQAQAAGGSVRKGERGTTVCYADRFTPKEEAERARDEDREARQLAFLRRFTVFNVDQCEGLPERVVPQIDAGPVDDAYRIPAAHALIEASGADFRIGGGEAYYSPDGDYVAVPPQQAFPERINWYRTVLHELGHWTGHGSRLGRDQAGGFGSAAYAREELVAEMASAFTCAFLSIRPTVRHADYVGSWLAVLREDEKALFRAASAASKAADYLLAFVLPGRGGHDRLVHTAADAPPVSGAFRAGPRDLRVGALRGSELCRSGRAPRLQHSRGRAEACARAGRARSRHEQPAAAMVAPVIRSAPGFGPARFARPRRAG